jgi:hypothetical protein
LGGTGAGKTTVLASLFGAMPHGERIAVPNRPCPEDLDRGRPRAGGRRPGGEHPHSRWSDRRVVTSCPRVVLGGIQHRLSVTRALRADVSGWPLPMSSRKRLLWCDPQRPSLDNLS